MIVKFTFQDVERKQNELTFVKSIEKKLIVLKYDEERVDWKKKQKWKAMTIFNESLFEAIA